jgi:competence ComEA-like helix-hairpin-helix protein
VNVQQDDYKYDEKINKDYNYKTFQQQENKTERDLFYFDPNKINEEDWIRLGVKENIAQRIINYRNKGGIFREKSDLLKTYGFKQEDFDALENYIVLDSVQFLNKTIEKIDQPFTGERMPTDLNSATLEQLIALGFNKNISNRILNFVNGVGGVYSAEQLKSIYGVDEEQLNEIIPFLIIDQSRLHLLNINSATEEELAKHTYITDELAHAIIVYRENSGRFVSVSEIMKVKGMYPALFEKLKPYLII